MITRSAQRGFTLVELMVTVTVMGILLTIAAPNFSDMLNTNRVQSQIRELYSQLSYARSEAVSRGRMVTICHSSNAASCGGTWSDGLITCIDTNLDGSCGVGETILRKYSELGQNTLTVVDDTTPAVAQASVSFKPDGSTLQTRKLTFAVCDSAGDVKFARAILKVGSGQLMMSSGTDAKGGNLTCP